MLVNVFRILWYLMLLLFNLNLTLSRRAAAGTFDTFCDKMNHTLETMLASEEPI